MSAIPADILRASEAAWNFLADEGMSRDEQVAFIARAILAERERCATIARNFHNRDATTEYIDGYHQAARDIAYTISGEELA